jgi:miniconductance mechanosensitive channel
MLEEFRRFDLVHDYIEDELHEYRQRYEARGRDMSDPVNAPRLTNVGVYRAYIEAYLCNHPDIHQEMTLLVRQLAPDPTGLPIEIYAFTTTIDWLEYEAVQAEIFDHLLAVLPEFELRVFQNRVGGEFKILPESV